MIYAIAAIIGAISNWYRGGPFKNRDKVVARIKNKYLHKITYWLVQGDTVNAFIWATFVTLTIGEWWAAWPAAFLTMYAGAAPGWGDYIGAAGGWRVGNLWDARKRDTAMVSEMTTQELGNRYAPLEELPYIDWALKPLRAHPRWWGVVGLSIRCALWGAVIGAPFLTLSPALGGLLAGPVVYGLSKIVPTRYVRVWVWPVFEMILGSIFFVSVLFDI